MATFSDDFNRANGAVGSNWTNGRGAFSVSSNQVAATDTAVASQFCYVNTSTVDFTDDHSAEITLATLSINDWIGPIVRASGSGGYIAISDGNVARIQKYTFPTTRTDLTAVTTSITTGNILKLTAVGTTITLYKNGTQVDQVTDSSYSTGQPGIYYLRNNNNSTRGDDFFAADIGGTSGLTITSVTPSSFDSGITGIVIAGSGFGASQGSSTVDIGGQAQTVTAWSDTSITITSARGSNSMGAASLKVTVR